MIRLFVLCLALLGLTILLSSAVLSFLSAGDEAKTQSPARAATRRVTQSLQEQNESVSRRALPIVTSASNPAVNNLSTDYNRLSESVGGAIELQVSTRLGKFVNNLAGSDQRREAVRSLLNEAYSEAASTVSASSAREPSRDANFIVNALESALDSDELTQLETFLEDASRQEFLATYTPQLDLVSPQLEAGNKKFLLETLFTETYAATNPDGNSAGQTPSFLTNQLDAIRLTRESIRGALSDAQLELANDFLDEQEAGLNTALEIFRTPEQ